MKPPLVIIFALGVTLSASATASAGITRSANVTLSFSKGAPRPALAANPSPTTVPFQLDRSHIGIVPGTTEKARAYGVAHRPIKIVSSFPGVSASYDVPSHTLSLTGVSRGSGTVTLIDASGAAATTAVLVAPPAGTVPADVNVELAGNVTPLFLATRVRDAIAQRAMLQPFVDVKVPSVSLPLTAGHIVQSVTVPVQVTLDGKGTFVNVTSKANVHVQIDGLPLPAAPQSLLYSDSPEYVTADGVLFRSITPVVPGRSARIYLYHVAMTEPRSFALVLRARDTAARRAHRRVRTAVGQISLHRPPRNRRVLARSTPPRERRRDRCAGSPVRAAAAKRHARARLDRGGLRRHGARRRRRRR